LTQVKFKCQIAMWGYVLTPASRRFTPNHNSETNTSQGKADYTTVKCHFPLCMDICWRPIHCLI